MFYKDRDRSGIRLHNYASQAKSNMRFIEEYFWKSTAELPHETNRQFSQLLQSLQQSKIPDDMLTITTEMEDLLETKKPEGIIKFRIPRIHEDVKAEMEADMRELERCYKAECYRSAVIMCGRILELALHRKYFDTTGRDILEKNPGIGLGNLIKKLVEKEVKLDPGLTQQIHLINSVRIFSVHKKKEPFNPTKAQTYAIILFTLDTLEKLF
tara:strand:+ start:1710 stop:2345 length:636 start_codon:yes stop_codon:yes gene_type:complete